MQTGTSDRVRENTAARVNERIDEQTRQNIAAYRRLSPGSVRERLAELEREWDIERVIAVEAPLTILTGLILGTTVNRKWLGLAGFASSMLLLHGVQGWYPLLPVLRRMGFRTHAEIQRERSALQAQLP